ncbi:ethanolamine ammonia-lyase subunit EutC [Williamsia sp. CHRR-6]|uniref:ethanolamine ammonia-lyase subunit EutC n=1 Tax=Williamsia sp. CHRR-6 TaxID=2835871 RepID=UPI0020249386|nr:ethanolamine ammonia-lyase subunit EutC [Williamsia sp. CHRR-6]
MWELLRRNTTARIGLGRAGDSLPTSRVLEFAAAHAAARDAVHQHLDVATFLDGLRGVGLGEPVVVRSQAADRGEYLRRPDLGRVPADLALEPVDADIGIVLADGLSPTAVSRHGVGVVSALKEVLALTFSIAPPVVAIGARVALGDHVGAAQRVQTVVVVIGERPGLSVADSVGIYLTHRPRPGRADSERNCVSNIHAAGQSYAGAARVVASLVAGARVLGRSGVDLKDTSRALTD